MVSVPAALALPLLATAMAAELAAQGSTLRQPQQSVFTAFPEADGYQVIVRNIDTTARRKIEAAQPFRVHFNEIGEHAVYVALRGRLPLGIVYVVQQEDAFGLSEIEWAITLELRLSGFRFQRTRNRHHEDLDGSGLARLMVGRSAADMSDWLDPDGRLLTAAQGVPAGAEQSATALIRSAMKALAVVGEVWATEVGKLNDLALGMPSFPTAQRFLRIWPPTKLAGQDEQPPAPAPERRALVVVAVRAFGNQSRPLGVVAKVTAPPAKDVLVTWLVDDAGVVVDATAPATASAALRAACLESIGKPIWDAGTRQGAAGKSAAELAALLQPAAPTGR